MKNKLSMINTPEYSSSGKLTQLEKEELDFYLKDYGIELRNFEDSTNKEFSNVNSPNKEAGNENTGEQIPDSTITTILRKDPYARYRLFAYEDNLFKINVSPVLGYSAGTRNGSKYSHRWNGISFYGYIGNSIGFSFSFRDNSEDGKTIDQTKIFTSQTGVVIAKADINNIQYSEVNTNISAHWTWGDVSIGKDFLNWGYGESGLLVLSDKAPSFPLIRLDIYPAPWLRFNYIHAWLNSDVVDSASSYPTLLQGQDRTILRDKYIASHTLTVTPFHGLDVSLGESIVYSDRLQLSYLMPIMFFRLADHYLSQGDNSIGANSQFFLGVSSRNQLKNTHLYGTLFIDELTLEGLADPVKQRNQFGFTLGGSITDLLISNLTFTAEFTKIFPYVYTHYIPTQTYQSSGYFMGHWMGNNADLIYGGINYRFIRGLQTTLWGQYIRKGEAGPEVGQYTQPQPPFLFGLRTNYFYLGVEMKYEITHELFARLQFLSTKSSKQQPDLSYNDHRMNEFYMSLYYGI